MVCFREVTNYSLHGRVNLIRNKSKTGEDGKWILSSHLWKQSAKSIDTQLRLDMETLPSSGSSFAMNSDRENAGHRSSFDLGFKSSPKITTCDHQTVQKHSEDVLGCEGHTY